jgi:hypothetical protein
LTHVCQGNTDAKAKKVLYFKKNLVELQSKDNL